MKWRKNIGLVLVFAALFIVLFGISFPKNPQKYIRSQFFLQKTFAPAKYNLVVMGDSRIYRGVSPRAMEEKLTGWRVLNLGYSNGGLNPLMFTVAQSKLVQPKLAKRNEPRAILIGITAFTLTPVSLENKHYLENRWMKREERIELLYFGGMLNWFSPVTPGLLRDHFTGKIPEQVYTNHYEYGGWVASNKFPPDTLEAFEPYRISFERRKVMPEIIDELMAQVAVWSKQGIAVYGFRPPIPQAMIALADTLAGYNQPEIVQGFEAAGGIWIDVNPQLYPTYDGSHLRPEAAVNLSNFIADEIAKHHGLLLSD
jgi:hypothetical protein